MHGRLDDFTRAGAQLLAIGFSPPEALAPLAEHLGWSAPFLSDPELRLYRALGIGRGRVRDVFNRGTLRVYGRALRRGRQIRRSDDDIFQLGADVIVRDGIAIQIVRPPTPDTRPSADELLDLLRTCR